MPQFRCWLGEGVPATPRGSGHPLQVHDSRDIPDGRDILHDRDTPYGRYIPRHPETPHRLGDPERYNRQ